MSRSDSFATAAVLLSIVTVSAWAQSPRPRQGDLKVGDAAPDFTVKDVQGKQSVKLSDLKGKPVVLIFGSCTCPPFLSSVAQIEKLYESYKDKAHVFLIYTREAHPVGGPRRPPAQFQISDPKTLEERQKVAEKFAGAVKLSVPVLVDSIDDQVEHAYTGWPDRIYILDRDGKIVHKGETGPRGFQPSIKEAPSILDKLLEGDAGVGNQNKARKTNKAA
jgi:glutathione peroxidase-family protein